jgi:hypothetical protein
MTRDRRLAREAAMQIVKRSILGVIARFFAVLIFHQSPLATETLDGKIEGARSSICEDRSAKSWCPGLIWLDYLLDCPLLEYGSWTPQDPARHIVRLENVNLAGGERWVRQELE